MSLFNWLRRLVLFGLSVKEHTGHVTVNTKDDSITIDLMFDPVDVEAYFVDEETSPSCAPIHADICYAEKGEYSFTIYWSVANERKIRWVAAERVL
jgi:hypothetical protein